MGCKWSEVQILSPRPESQGQPRRLAFSFSRRRVAMGACRCDTRANRSDSAVQAEKFTSAGRLTRAGAASHRHAGPPHAREWRWHRAGQWHRREAIDDARHRGGRLDVLLFQAARAAAPIQALSCCVRAVHVARVNHSPAGDLLKAELDMALGWQPVGNGCSYIISAISIVNEGRAAGAAAASASHRIGLHVQSTQVHLFSSVGNEGSLARLRWSGLHGVLRLCRSRKPTPTCGLDPCSHAHTAE